MDLNIWIRETEAAALELFSKPLSIIIHYYPSSETKIQIYSMSD